MADWLLEIGDLVDELGVLALGDEVWCEEDAEGVGELGLGASVFADQESLEDGLVEASANVVRCILVGIVAVAEEVEAALQGGVDRFELDFGGGDEITCGVEFLADPVLLGVFHRYGMSE